MAKLAEELNEAKVLNAEQFLGLADRLKTEYVDLSELGINGGVWIRELTARQRDDVMKMGGRIRINKDESQDFDLSSLPPGSSIKIALMGICTDDSGNELMFSRKDEHKLNGMPSAVIDLIVKRIRRLSGMSKDADEEAKKNSTATLNGNSGTS